MTPITLPIILTSLLLSQVAFGQRCRFANQYTQTDILKDPSAFEADVFQWEGMFHQHNVSYNAVNGMTFDGTLLNPTTGIHDVNGIHGFSAASKESLHFMVLTHVIAGNQNAARWILAAHGGGTDVEKARSLALDILNTKWASYSKFNETYPGFGGFLPWFAHTEFQELSPTWDWVNRVPALDNGENIWAIYGLIEALQTVKRPQYTALAAKWQGYLSYLATTAGKVFYHGSGRICAVVDIADQSKTVDDPTQTYQCEGLNSGGNPFINDPYEGQQFMWFLYFFGGLNATEKAALLEFKRPQLVAVDWSRPGFPNVIVQKGFWFSSHENWGWTQLPYTDVPLMKNLYSNMEKVRTCDSAFTKNPGMFASVNNSTDSSGQIIGYISNAGIPQIANQTIQELDVITPYSTMNTMITNKRIGLAWWHNMAIAKRMQNPYGSSESTRKDGSATSAFVSWDSKITTLNGLLGGISPIVKSKMIRDGIYAPFVALVQREWGMVFGSLLPLKGSDMAYCLPVAGVADTGLVDFTECR
ncbi:hypothetical protein CVT24_006439 [Panaeolus cyanescens]|uniref:Endo-beta-1,2-glucanase SGL domain-containing protein n=1 Tax=Panaeolus cyanescens TaxID=181874 RepID=A0A409VZ76_9AGAR|nr:hypothetical protein CVT24_006439 [Panaeolus cyanescens]